MSASGIITRRRKWSAAAKAALLTEVEAEGGKVAVVARRHGMSESVLYNWRSASKAAEGLRYAPEAVAFMPLGVVGGMGQEVPAMLASQEAQRQQFVRAGDNGAGAIEIALPNGARISVDAFVNEAALARVLRAMKRAP